MDEVVGGYGADFVDGDERVEALVVGGTVDVDAHGFAVAGERVAVAAGGEVGHHHFAGGLVDVAKDPLDLGQDRVREWLDDAALGSGEISGDERDIAKEKRSADRVLRCEEGGFGVEERVVFLLGPVAGDGDSGGLLDGLLLDLIPELWVGTPGVVGGLDWGERGWNEAGEGVVDGAELELFAGGPDFNGAVVTCKGDLNAPGSRGGIVVSPGKLRRDDLRRVDGSLDGDIDGEGWRTGRNALGEDGHEERWNGGGTGGGGGLIRLIGGVAALGDDLAGDSGYGGQQNRRGH